MLQYGGEGILKDSPQQIAVCGGLFHSDIIRYGITDVDQWCALGKNLIKATKGRYLGAINLKKTDESQLPPDQMDAFDHIITVNGNFFVDLPETITRAGIKLPKDMALKFAGETFKNGKTVVTSTTWEASPLSKDPKVRCVNLCNMNGDVAKILECPDVEYYVVTNHGCGAKELEAWQALNDKEKINALKEKEGAKVVARYPNGLASAVFAIYAIHPKSLKPFIRDSKKSVGKVALVFSDDEDDEDESPPSTPVKVAPSTPEKAPPAPKKASGKAPREDVVEDVVMEEEEVVVEPKPKRSKKGKAKAKKAKVAPPPESDSDAETEDAQDIDSDASD